jgi:hypothetical protein
MGFLDSEKFTNLKKQATPQIICSTIRMNGIIMAHLILSILVLRKLHNVHKCTLISKTYTKRTLKIQKTLSKCSLYTIHLSCCNHFELELLVSPITQTLSYDFSGCLWCFEKAYFSPAFSSLIASSISVTDLEPFMTSRSIVTCCFCLGRGSFGVVTLSAA